MPALGYHVVFRLRDSRAIAPTVAARRRLARVVFAIGERSKLLAFRASWDHLHAQVACGRAEAGAFAQAVGSALKQVLDVPEGFSPARLTPIEDGRHLSRTFAYVLRNAEKHGLVDDPLHEASSLPDLLGLRVVGTDAIPRVRSLLPATSRPQLLDALGVPELESAFVADWLVDAAAGAMALPDLSGASDDACRARRAAARVGSGLVAPSVLADVLGVTSRTLRRLCASAPDPVLERAIPLRMGLRAAFGTRAIATAPIGTGLAM